MTDTVRDWPLSPRPVARALSLSVFRHRGEQRVDCRGCEAKINPLAPAAGEHRVEPAGEHPHRQVRGRLVCTVVGPEDGDATVVSVFTEEGRLALPALAAKYPQYVAQAPAGPLIRIAVDNWTSWSAQ